MNRIDLSRSLSYIGDDLIAEAEASRNMQAAKKPQFARRIAIAACAALVISAAVFTTWVIRTDIPSVPFDICPPPVTLNTVATDEQNEPHNTIPHDEQTNRPTVTEEPPITSADNTDENAAPTEPDESDELHHIGGSDITFSRKYIDKVYNIYIPSKIVGNEKRDEWVNNVLLIKTPKEQEDPPTVYQMIRDLNISKEDFIKENDKYIDYPDMYFSEDIISALYLDDVEEMKKQLVNPLALYYNGKIYTFDELSQNPELAGNISKDVISGYLDFIYDACVEAKLIKYMQEEFDTIRSYIKE